MHAHNNTFSFSSSIVQAWSDVGCYISETELMIGLKFGANYIHIAQSRKSPYDRFSLIRSHKDPCDKSETLRKYFNLLLVPLRE